MWWILLHPAEKKTSRFYFNKTLLHVWQKLDFVFKNVDFNKQFSIKLHGMGDFESKKQRVTILQYSKSMLISLA